MKERAHLLFFVGSLNSSFVQNELSYLYKKYPDASIYFFDADEGVLEQLRKYKFEFIRLNKITPLKINYSKAFKTFFLKENRKIFKHEFKYVFSKSKNRLGRLLYYIYYVLAYNSFLMANELDFGQYEKVILYSYWLSNSAFICAMLKKTITKKNIDVKFVSRAHGYDLYEYRNKYKYLPFRYFIFDSIDILSPISNDGREYLLRYNMVERNKVFTNRLGVSDTGYSKNIELNKNKIVIASCSSVIEVKRIDLIIDFINELSKKTKLDILWIHIGDGELMGKIKEYAKKTLLSSNYCFFGKKDNYEVRKILVNNKVNFFINLSDSEGIPVAIMEAISLGIPAIARNVGGNNEIVNKNTGYLLDSKMSDSENAIDFIISHYDNTELRKSCHEYWDKYYNSSVNYGNFYKYL